MGMMKILVVDDEPKLEPLIRQTFRYEIKNSKICFAFAQNGMEALDILRADADIDIVLTDIKMPKMDGLTVLKHIRESEKLNRLPVVILTTSKDEEDRLKSYDLRVNAYIIKPIGFDNFSEAVKTINLFWELVELPGESYGNR